MKRPKQTDFISKDIYDLDGYSKAIERYALYLEGELAKYETLKAALKQLETL